MKKKITTEQKVKAAIMLDRAYKNETDLYLTHNYVQYLSEYINDLLDEIKNNQKSDNSEYK